MNSKGARSTTQSRGKGKNRAGARLSGRSREWGGAGLQTGNRAISPENRLRRLRKDCGSRGPESCEEIRRNKKKNDRKRGDRSGLQSKTARNDIDTIPKAFGAVPIPSRRGKKGGPVSMRLMGGGNRCRKKRSGTSKCSKRRRLTEGLT